jgi:hypothetical protein
MLLLQAARLPEEAMCFFSSFGWYLSDWSLLDREMLFSSCCLATRGGCVGRFFHRLDSYLLIGLVSISVFFCLFKSSLDAFVLGPWVHCNK